MHDKRGSLAFTLIEVLTVVSLIAILSAILFPVFAGVRSRARETSCLSNLRQIGLAIAMYVQDYDDIYPIGADSKERYTDAELEPSKLSVVQTMPLLRDILTPYVKTSTLWFCPADTGVDGTGLEFGFDLEGNSVKIKANPTVFLRFGTSYHYRLSLGLNQVKYPAGCIFGEAPNLQERGPERTAVLRDIGWLWHRGRDEYGYSRWNVLLADGHVRNAPLTFHFETWSVCVPR